MFPCHFNLLKTGHLWPFFYIVAGECWSGGRADRTNDKYDPSEFCITKEFAVCDANDQNACGGNKKTTFVYSIKEKLETHQGKRY